MPPAADPRVDAYIEAARPFARPILRHLRSLVRRGCPEVVETIKWGFPHFEREGVICSMAAFKEHCAFTLWRGGEVLGDSAREGAMGQFGRITTLSDLPDDDTLVAYVRKAAELRAAGTARRKPPKAPRPEVPPPPDFLEALRESPDALATWEGFPPSHRREYLEWITEAKRPETRARRMTQALAWLAEGKPRNWKYR